MNENNDNLNNALGFLIQKMQISCPEGLRILAKKQLNI